MADVRIELDSAGIQELLKSAEIASVCESEAQKMTAATGVKYVSDVFVGRTRVNAKAVAKAETVQQLAGSSQSAKQSNARTGKKVAGY